MISPLAPATTPHLTPIKGVRLGGIEAGIKYKDRRDLAAIVFEKPAAIAGVFTKSRCPSAPVDWCRENLAEGAANCMIINSGNANAFTGKKGKEAVELTAAATASVFGVPETTVFLASTGVIGEPLNATGFETHLETLKTHIRESGWQECAETIMTTDTYPKLSSAEFTQDGTSYRINGIVKGSGMIAPDMATMLGFIVTDYPINSHLLQPILSSAVEDSFNAITVDSDTSTSDSVMAFSTCPENCTATSADDDRLSDFKEAIGQVCHELAMLVVRDGEGATKHVEINVTGATTDASAKKIAMAIANSPLVKTAIAGCDANWGRIVMAVGKAGEPADRDRLKIGFGDIVVAEQGERAPDYSEEAAANVMRKEYIPISVDLGLGTGEAKVWTCDLTKQYVAINGDYRS